jgi:enoyl-CoA hydratase/carnithine racemase
MEQLLTYAVAEEIALIGLNRPGKRNAINFAKRAEPLKAPANAQVP